METPPSAKDREISVRHGGDLAPVKLLAGNAFTLAYVTARINQKIPAFDSTFKLCYNDPSGTEKEDYTLNTDEDLKEAFMKFDAVSPPMKAKFVTMKKGTTHALHTTHTILQPRLALLQCTPVVRVPRLLCSELCVTSGAFIWRAVLAVYHVLHTLCC